MDALLGFLAGLGSNYGLAGLFVSGLLSATLLPGNSELALLVWLQAQPATVWSALLMVTLGNTLGSLSSYGLGRLAKISPSLSPTVLRQVQRWGAYSLLLAWLPIVGDALCMAAGYLRLPLAISVACIAIGKCLRYLLLAMSTLL